MQKNNDIKLPEGFTLDLNSLVETHDEVYLHDGDEEHHIFLLDESKQIVIPGPHGKRGEQGQQGIPGPGGLQGIMGVRGDSGVAGVRGLKGPTGSDGKEGDKGDQGPAIEWEFCEINFDKKAGIRFKNPNGSFGDCVRFKGIDGEDGSHAPSTGGGGGGGGITVQPYKQLTILVPANSTKVITTLPASSTRAVKWIVTMEGLVTSEFQALESLMINKNTEIDWNQYAEIGDHIKYDLNFDILDYAPAAILPDLRIRFSFINKTNEDLKVDLLRLPLSIRSL